MTGLSWSNQFRAGGSGQAELLHRLDQPAAARAAYQQALALGMSAPQARRLRRRIAELG